MVKSGRGGPLLSEVSISRCDRKPFESSEKEMKRKVGSGGSRFAEPNEGEEREKKSRPRQSVKRADVKVRERRK